jgi:hypothetical protein
MIRKLLFAIALFVLAGTASAQVGEIGLSFGKSSFRNKDLGTDGTSRYGIDGNFRLGVRLTLNSFRYFGHEFGYGYTRASLKADGSSVSMPVHQFGYSFLAYATPEGSRIRPFAAGGGGFTSFYPPGTGVYYGNGYTKFGFHYGGGIKVKLTPIFALRLDVRDYTTGKPFPFEDRSGLLHLLETSAGLSFVF